MSCQPPQWARRNASPKQQPRPVRATLPVSLMRQPNQGSPTKNNAPKSPSNTVFDLDKPKATDDEKPTLFLGPRGEKSKTLNLRTQPPQYHIRRTASLDALFLTASWQPETVFLGHFMVDKATQTPGEWTESEWRKAQWKSMVTGGEHLEVKYIRQKLQRTNQNSRASNLLLCAQRQSPLQGDHSAVSNLDSCCMAGVHHAGAFGGVMHIVAPGSSAGPAAVSSRPIPIAQGPKPNSPRLQSSLESINQEIEKIVLKDSAGTETEGSAIRVFEPTPDGHRAPIAELFHSINSPGHESSSSGEIASRSHSTSPVIPIIPGNSDYSISPSTDDADCIYKFSSSPHINQFLTREPPDGCEKVKIDEESRRQQVQDFSAGGLLKPQVTRVLLPSQSSAFCPLYKELKVPGPLYDQCNKLPPTPSTSKCHK